MDLQLTDKRAVVTGGSRGLGLAIAAELGAEGVRVALLARESASVEAAAAALRSRGVDAIGVSADTRSDDDAEAAFGIVLAELGGVDILVNGAARPAGAPPPSFLDLAHDDLRDEVETKVLGYLRCIRAAVPGMVERGWGRIINIGGLTARRTGSVFGSVRNVSVAAMSKNLADELGPLGVNVTTVHPGLTLPEGVQDMIRARAAATGTHPDEIARALATDVGLGRLVRPEEVAHVVAFLTSPLSVALNGDAVLASGGTSGPIHY